jgi:hypothetical protein
MLALWGVTYEERLLQSFMLSRNLAIHPAFMRNTLCFIAQKRPGVVGWTSETPARDFSALAATRAEIVGVRDRLAAGNVKGALRHLERLLAISRLPERLGGAPGRPPVRPTPGDAPAGVAVVGGGGTDRAP